MLGDEDTGSTRAQSSGGIYGNIENSAFDVGRSVQVVIFGFFLFYPSTGIIPTHTHSGASPRHWLSRLSPFNALEFEQISSLVF